MTQHELIKKDLRILVVDDEQGMRDVLNLDLTTQGYDVRLAMDASQALEVLQQEKIHMVISDIKMPGMNGLELLEKIKAIDPRIEVIIMTGHGTVENAVQAMKKGAYDFILKPFNLDEMRALIEKAIEKKELKGLVALYESTKKIFSTVRLHDLCEQVMDTMMKAFDAETGAILLRGDMQKLFIAAGRGVPDKVSRETQLEMSERAIDELESNQKEMLLVNGAENHPAFKDMPGVDGISSSIFCPLMNLEGELLGILNLNRLKGRENFTISDLQGSVIFASLASMGIANAKLFDQLESKITELDQTRDQLVQAEKLASIGRLVAGVAHEMNNPLTSVIGYSHMASQSSNPEEIKKALPIIYEQAMRCSKIIKELLIFARQKKINRKNIDVCKVVEDSITAVTPELRKRNIQVLWDKPQAPLNLSIDAGLLQQVFTNLLTNAFQAMEEQRGEKKIIIFCKITDSHVFFYIRDTGPGIPADIMPKIFDPFFTTKEVGQGTGLGLSLSYGIMREHGGTLTVEKDYKDGASFEVKLPLNAEPGTQER